MICIDEVMNRDHIPKGRVGGTDVEQQAIQAGTSGQEEAAQ